MLYYATKIFISAFILVAVSEIAKRSSLLGALLASLPLTSLLAFVWLYLDTGDTQKISALSSSILWLVLPSLALFLTLPLLIKLGWGFCDSSHACHRSLLWHHAGYLETVRGAGVTADAI